MALRVTQGMMYNSMVHNMNSTLSAYIESNMQSSSQKRVNRPSDDPVSAGRILDTRATISKLSDYDKNTKTAMGWLGLADNILASGDGSVHTVLSLIKSTDIQSSTGTINQENRLEIASAIRQYMEQLVNLANTQYGDQHIFAGQKTDAPPYHIGLGVSVKDPEGGLEGVQYHVEGASESTVLITPVGEPGTAVAADAASYMFSTDGGKSWQAVSSVTSEYAVDPLTGPGRHLTTLDTGIGVTVEISNPGTNAAPMVTPAYKADELNDAVKTGEGTWMYVRPTAIYSGDDDSTQVTASYWNPGADASPLSTSAEGHFIRDVAVRLDSVDNVASPPRLYYSFSTDNGSNWTQSSAPVPSTGSMKLSVPGGYLEIADASNLAPHVDKGAGSEDRGSQFIIHPHRADINFQIGDNDSITVNMVGKDIFGGLYNYPESSAGNAPGNQVYPHAEPVPGANMFETLGKLVAGLETNDQSMVQDCLEELDEVMSLVRTRVAEIGGRENRLIVTQAALTMRTYTEQDSLSQMEDIDVTELMTRLSQQQIAYNSVLKSSSMIMQMSLVNFL